MVTRTSSQKKTNQGKLKNMKLRSYSLVLAFLGILDSLYLTWVKLAGSEAYCAGIGDCDTVNSSPYSEIAGFPIALLGVGAYMAIFLLLSLETQGGFWKENALIMVFGLTLTGVLYSIYLTYVEVAILRAICPYCVISALLLFILLGISIVRIVRVED
jgi:uncharacterized membrane protein